MQVRTIFSSVARIALCAVLFFLHTHNSAVPPQPGQNFQSVLATVGTQVDTLVTCCATTFTAIAGVSSLITTDFNNTMTALAPLPSLITTDFNNTMTVLAAISQFDTTNVNATFTALAAINSLITQDFNATMTAIAAIPAVLTAGFNNTFTALAGLSPIITTDFNQTMTALAGLSSLITTDFNNSFTAINALGLCNPIPLSQSSVSNGGMRLTTTGATYCLSQNITGSIIISAADITVDLNTHSLIGTIDILSSSTNATIKNGNVKPLAPINSTDASHAAMVIASTVDKALIKNCYIVCSDSTIAARDGIANGGTNTIIDSCFIQASAGGTGATGGNGVAVTGAASLVSNCTILAGTAGAPGAFMYIGNDGAATFDGRIINSTTGNLSTLSGSPFTGGTNNTWVALTPDFTKLYTSGGTTVSGFTLNAAGFPTPVAGSPFANAGGDLAVSSDGKHLYVVNNVNNVSVSGYSINVSTGVLSAVAGSPFTSSTAPISSFSIAITPDGKYVYVGNDNSVGTGTVSGFSRNSTTGVLTALAGFPFTVGTSIGGIAITPDSKFAYIVNGTGTGQITGYSINTSTGALTSIGSTAAGSSPGFMVITPDEKYLYVTNFSTPTSNGYSINSTTGALTSLGITSVGTAYNLAMTPDGTKIYFTTIGNTLTGFSINSSTGGLTALSGSPYTISGSLTQGIAITSVLGTGGTGGVGIVQQATNGKITNNIITGGAGGTGGAAISQQASNGVITNNIVTGGSGGTGGAGVSVTASTDLNTIESCVAINSGGNGFTMLTTGTVNILDCIANYNLSSGFDLSGSTGKGLVKACVASRNFGCGFKDRSTSLYQYVSNVAEGNDSNPAVAAGDSNYCWSDFSNTSTFTSPSGPGSNPFFQFTSNNTGATLRNLSVWNNITT